MFFAKAAVNDFFSRNRGDEQASCTSSENLAVIRLVGLAGLRRLTILHLLGLYTGSVCRFIKKPFAKS